MYVCKSDGNKTTGVREMKNEKCERSKMERFTRNSEKTNEKLRIPNFFPRIRWKNVFVLIFFPRF